jgi:hypothetical protein
VAAMVTVAVDAMVTGSNYVPDAATVATAKVASLVAATVADAIKAV